jgi:hypothetical protein
MRLAVLIPSILAAVVATPLIVAAFLPRTYTVSREIIVARPASQLSTLVADFSTRTRWIPWAVTEPDASYIVTGTAGEYGSQFSWNGAKVGAGTATLTSHTVGSRVETALDFTKPMSMRATDTFAFDAIDPNHTRVTWTNRGTLAYPIGRLFGLVADKVIGNDYAAGLVRLQSVAEADAQTVAVTR